MSLVRSALAGLATGGRTFSGISALVASVPPGTTSQPDATLAKPQAQAVLGLLAAGEAVADKLPFAPSRLDFPGLQGRVLFGAACGVIIARRSATVPGAAAFSDAASGAAVAPGRPAVPPAQVAVCAVVGAAAAVAGSYGGSRFRTWASGRTGHDWIGAFVEDAAVVALTVAAVKSPGPAN